ncbi:DMT family transporter [Lachnospiraceae bacterium OttesenSCG-928-E19]|nr:DMT family transporter [Lachnospiraceae bacterium OttesenSCG-928-E19]
MKRIGLKSGALLFLTAFIWGVAFVAQSAATDFAEPFTFNAIRNLLGGLVLIPCIYMLDRGKKKHGNRMMPNERRLLVQGGISCGVILFIAANLQQIGIEYTTAGKAGFITAIYIVLVPLIRIVFKQYAGVQVWIGVLLAAIGLYCLCVTENLTFQGSDLYLLVSACCFAGHILVIDYFSPKVDGVKMACIQFFVCGILSAIFMVLFETPQLELILTGWFPILYAGVLSCGVAYTLQIVGQRDTDPTIASLILSLESVISVLAGWVLLGERLNLREGIGCLLMFSAIILTQLPERKSVDCQIE